MHLIFFPKYSKIGASSRYRFYQYLPIVPHMYLTVLISPLFADSYLEHKFNRGGSRLRDILSAVFRRFFAVLNVPSGATVLLEHELLPYMPAVLERWLIYRGCCLIVDYDDAIFHRYDSHKSRFVRKLLGKKIASVMRLANIVTVGNAYLSDYARRADVKRLEVIPTVIDLVRYPLGRRAIRSQALIIGWIGSPSTVGYLRHIAPALARVCKNGHARVCLIGSGPINLPGVPVELIPWIEETEVSEISHFDVGIMPLPDESWARGKCGFKLIQYMACALPVVASPVGVNREIVEHGENGYLATSIEECVDALEILRLEPELRGRLGASGRRRVEEKYCLSVTSPTFVELLTNCRAQKSHL